MYNFEALDDKQRQEMLSAVGVQSIEELYDCISDVAKIKNKSTDGISTIISSPLVSVAIALSSSRTS